VRARSSPGDVTAQRASEDHLRHLAATDALTGLANYGRLSETLERGSMNLGQIVSELKRERDDLNRAIAALVYPKL